MVLLKSVSMGTVHKSGKTEIGMSYFDALNKGILLLTKFVNMLSFP